MHYNIQLTGLPLKDIQTEGHLYHCMALVANSLNFTWSRWNLLSGYDKLIMQFRERLPGAPEINHQVSMLSTFYKQLFCMKVFCTAFLLLQFRFAIFWLMNIFGKPTRKMLVKLVLMLSTIYEQLFANYLCQNIL